jgi:hypothetical protein
MRVIEEEPQYSFDLDLILLFAVPLIFVAVSYLAYMNFSRTVVPPKKDK